MTKSEIPYQISWTKHASKLPLRTRTVETKHTITFMVNCNILFDLIS